MTNLFELCIDCPNGKHKWISETLNEFGARIIYCENCKIRLKDFCKEKENPK